MPWQIKSIQDKRAIPGRRGACLGWSASNSSGKAMNLSLRLRMQTLAAGLCLLLGPAFARRPPAAPGNARLQLVPHFAPGQKLHYQFEIRTSTNAHSTGPIADPEAASMLTQTAVILVRLDVLEVDPAAPGSMGHVRLRATYEKVNVSTESDAYDPQAAAIEEQYRKLEGHSMEFTLGPDGKVSELVGLDAILPDASAAGAFQAWMSGLSAGSAFPRNGIAIGDKWTAQQPLTGAPLNGIVWRSESTYLRNEVCRSRTASAEPVPPASDNAQEGCSVLLTQFKIVQQQTRGDLTPEDYRRNGLRTSGKWSGSGESLELISMRTGFVTSVTQTSTQEMNFTISSASSPARLTYSGRVRSQSQITLLPEALQ